MVVPLLLFAFICRPPSPPHGQVLAAIALSDWGTIASIVSAVMAVLALVFVALQARNARRSAEAAGRSVAAAEAQAVAARRAAAAAEEQAAALREGSGRQERRDEEQRNLAYPRLRIGGGVFAQGGHVMISHAGGRIPATRAHVVLIQLTERFEGELSLLPVGQTQPCTVERVDRVDAVDHFPDQASALSVTLRTFVGIIWTSPAGGRGRFAATLGDDSRLKEILDEVDARIPGY